MTSEFQISNGSYGAEYAFQAAPELMLALLPLAETRVVAAGKVIIKQGSLAKGVYLLAEGSARLYLVEGESSGIQAAIRNVGSGSLIGLPAVLCSIPYAFTAKAAEECRIGFIEGGQLNEFLRERTALCMQVVQMLSRELSALNAARESKRVCTNTDCALSGVCRHCS